MNAKTFKNLGFFQSHDLLKHASVMFIATIISGAFNYLYQLYIGRALGPEEFGVFGSLFAIFYIISILTTTIQTGSARFVSKYVGENEQSKINYFKKGMIKRSFLLGLVLFSIIILSSRWIAIFLNIDSVIPIVIIGSAFLFSAILPVNLGVFQGMQKFITLGTNNVIGFLSKLILGIILVSIGFGVNGALGAVVIGSLIALIFSFLGFRRIFLDKSDSSNNIHFSEVYLYSLSAFAAMFCYAVPGNVDVIIAKHFLSSHTAGLYTSVTVLGKILLFIPGAIVAVMFPKVSELHSGKNYTGSILNLSLFYTGIVSGILALGYWFFPSIFIGIPFGYEYLEVSPVLQVYGVGILFFSLTVVLMRYSLAIHNVKYMYILIFFTFIEIALFLLFHGSIINMAKIVLIVNIILFIIGYYYLKRNLPFQNRLNLEGKNVG